MDNHSLRVFVKGVSLALPILIAAAGEASALDLTFNSPSLSGAGYGTPLSNEYLIIGVDDGNKAITYSNAEAGQQSNSVPSTGDQDDGPSLGGNTVILPTGNNAAAIDRFNAPQTPNPVDSSRGPNTEQFFDGNMAVIDPQGQFVIENVDISADNGVDCASSAAACDGGSSGSEIDQTDNNNFDYQNFGAGNNGVNGSTNFSDLVNELDTAVEAIQAFTNTGTITESTLTGQNTVTFSSGFHVIDINPGGEFKLDNAALTIKGTGNTQVLDSAKFAFEF
ncbi:MAG: hypothetical protein AAFR42_20720 [Cyanobacteria bacterium J06628_6]